MKWVVNGQDSDKDSAFILNTASGDQLKIQYSDEGQSVRIYCPRKINRKYIQEKYGWLKNRFLFRNEYGVEIGKLVLGMWNKERGSLELYQNRFFYHIQKLGSKIGLVILDNNKSKICETEFPRETLKQKILNTPEELSGLLLSICWFITESGNS
jgi:hypothetical protein